MGGTHELLSGIIDSGSSRWGKGESPTASSTGSTLVGDFTQVWGSKVSIYLTALHREGGNAHGRRRTENSNPQFEDCNRQNMYANNPWNKKQ